jgi:hypothetical protein
MNDKLTKQGVRDLGGNHAHNKPKRCLHLNRVALEGISTDSETGATYHGVVIGTRCVACGHEFVTT